MNKKLQSSIILLSLIIASLSLYTFYIDEIPYKKSDYKKAILTVILSNETTISFHCHLAISPQQQQQGLMNKTSLPQNQGMLFVINPPRNVSFWMKNTFIPLDIIFIDETNTIIQLQSAIVEHNTSDINLTRYQSIEPVAYVLEINYGLSQQYQINKGMRCIIEYE